MSCILFIINLLIIGKNEIKEHVPNPFIHSFIKCLLYFTSVTD